MEELAKDYEGLERQYLALRSIVNAKERTLAKANARESVLSCQLDSHIERVKELESQVEFKIKECMELAQSCYRYNYRIEQLRKEQERWKS